MIIQRDIQKTLEASFFKGKVVILYGARQVGKTTLIHQIRKKYGNDADYLNCDEKDIREALTDKTSTELIHFLGSKKIIFLDEAQRVQNIGLTLKLLVDNFPKMQIVATGSSSFELSNAVVEPLTGRKYEFHLYPFSVSELTEQYSSIEMKRLLETRMIFGMYPEVVEKPGEAESNLNLIADSYLSKDILAYQGIRKPEILQKLLSALALQVGNEASYRELSGLVGTNKETTSSYLRILEQAFIVFRLMPLSRHLRKEISKSRKVFFYDNGVRNALISNMNPLSRRQDVGALWENFLVSERIKHNSNAGRTLNIYFWRTHDGQEIDYVEDEGGKLHGFEFKWSGKKARKRAPAAWRQAYPDALFSTITPENYLEFVV
ncbi:ATP-binding protein [bacterium]|nr:ATP-binding protein [bacterium]